MEKQPDISVLFVVLLTAFATFWSIKKDTADYTDYIRNGGAGCRPILHRPRTN